MFLNGMIGIDPPSLEAFDIIKKRWTMKERLHRMISSHVHPDQCLTLRPCWQICHYVHQRGGDGGRRVRTEVMGRPLRNVRKDVSVQLLRGINLCVVPSRTLTTGL